MNAKQIEALNEWLKKNSHPAVPGTDGAYLLFDSVVEDFPIAIQYILGDSLKSELAEEQVEALKKWLGGQAYSSEPDTAGDYLRLEEMEKYIPSSVEEILKDFLVSPSHGEGVCEKGFAAKMVVKKVLRIESLTLSAVDWKLREVGDRERDARDVNDIIRMLVNQDGEKHDVRDYVVRTLNRFYADSVISMKDTEEVLDAVLDCIYATGRG